jgi:hypothetical protein
MRLELKDLKRFYITAIKNACCIFLKNILRKNKTGRARRNRRNKKTFRTQRTTNHNDSYDCPYIYIEIISSNRGAKFTPFISRGKFGSFFVVHKLDKPVGGAGCRSPPMFFVF